MDAETKQVTSRAARALTMIAAGGMAVGLLLRLVWYLGGRVLWFDEAALAISIVQRGFVGLLGRLAYDQLAPPGFLWLERLAVLGLGDTELALRLVPLLAGLAAVVATAVLGRKLLGRTWGLASAGMAALSWPLVYYSAEVKQYGLEALVAAALLFLALDELHNEGSHQRPWLLALAGFGAMWFSYSAVFVLPSLIAAAALRRGAAGRRTVPCRSAALAAAWAGGFATLYMLLIRRSAGMACIQVYWQDQYLGRISPAAISSVLFAPLSETLGFTFGVLAAATLVIIGTIWILRQWPAEGMILLLPFLATAGASALGLYPVGGRLLLFLAPASFVLLAAGLRALAAVPWRGAGIAAALLAVALFADLGARSIPPRDLRALPDLRQHIMDLKVRARPDDLIYLSYWTSRPFMYYASRLGFQPRRALCGLPSDDPSSWLRPLLTIRGEPRVWVLLAPSPFIAGDMTTELAVLHDVARCRLVTATPTSTLCLCTFPPRMTPEIPARDAKKHRPPG